MIGTSSRTTEITGLLNYLENGENYATAPVQREGFVFTHNLPSDDHEVAAEVMKATAELSSRVEKPYYHLILAWHEDDTPTDEQMAESAREMIEHLGLSEYQVYGKQHTDTDHPHLHLAVNRVHPVKGTAWRGENDHYRIRDKCQQLEQKHDWVRTQKYGQTRGYTLAEHEIVTRLDSQIKLNDPSLSQEDKQAAIARINYLDGQKPNPGLHLSKTEVQKLRDRVDEPMRKSVDWADLDTRLGRKRLELRVTGNGIRVYRGDHYAKFSELVPQGTNAKKIHAKLGDFRKYMKAKQRREARRLKRKRRTQNQDPDQGQMQ